jgi:indolepyruvate decarboxylase
LTRALAVNQSRRRPAGGRSGVPLKKTRPFKVQPDKPCSVRRFFERINEFIDEGYMVICDIGDSLFGAADLTIHRKTEFISPAFYTSMGFAVPAAIGTQINRKNLRPLVFVGDGAFQMTGMELSTIARYGLNPIIFVLNNKGYTTERFIRNGPYNDIHDWAYHLVPQILRKGWGCEVKTEGELEEALRTARSNINSFSLINIHLDKLDHSRALKRLGARLGKKTMVKKRHL